VTIIEMVIATTLLGLVMTGLAVSALTVFTARAPAQARLEMTHAQTLQRLENLRTTVPPSTSPPSDSPSVPILPVAHRCRGSITVLIDTSLSVYNQGAAPSMVTGIGALLDAVTGTSMRLRLLTFNLSASTLAPTSTTGAFTAMLLASSERTTLRTAVEALDDSITPWRSGSNWEDALWQATRRDVGTMNSNLPDLIILVTDGEPTRNRLNTASDGDDTFQSADLTRATTAATYARNTGASLAGIIVGPGATPTALGYLQTVIGSDVSSGSFADLPNLLRTVMRSRCGSTLTLVPRIDTAGVLGPASGTWTMSLGGTTQTIDTTSVSSLTVDINASTTISNVSAPGMQSIRVECTANNQPVLTSTVLPVVVPTQVDTTTSCQLIGRTS
jgi:hypothetical protein